MPAFSTLPLTPSSPRIAAEILFVTHADSEPWSSNPRADADRLDDEMRELIAAVSANGVRQSLTVRPHLERPNFYQIAAGARRWYALGHAIRAGERPADDPLPVRVERLSAFEMVVVALEENLQRKAMTPLEEAEAYAALAAGAQPGDRVTASIAKRVGKTQRHVQVYINLLVGCQPAPSRR